MTEERLSAEKLPPIKARYSSYELHSISQQKYAEQLVPLDDLASETRYDSMTDKQLIKEHEILVRRLFKYRELVDIMVARSAKKKEIPKKQKSVSSSSDIVQKEITNNMKIIANYLNQMRDIDKSKTHRTLDEVLGEQRMLQEKMATLKKEIFDLKNQDVMSARNLTMTHQQRERQEIDTAYKFELNKNDEYRKRLEQLQAQLDQLRKKVIQSNKDTKTGSSNALLVQKLADRKDQLERLKTEVSGIEHSMDEFYNVKTRRNQGIMKETQTLQKKIKQFQKQIEQYRNRARGGPDQ